MKLSKGFIFTGLAALCWAISIVLTKVVVKTGENVYNILFWVAIISLPYWIYLFSKQKKEFKKISKRELWILIGLGLVSGLLVGLIEMFALKYTTSINYAFLIRTTILFTIILAYFFFDEKITLKKIILIVILLLGVFLLTTKGKMLSFSLGDILTLIEALLIAFGNTILGKIAVKTMSSKLSSSASNIVGLSLLALLAVFTRVVSVPNMFLVIVLIVPVAILEATFRFIAYKHATASYIAMVYSLTPVFVLIIALSLLGESIEFIQLIGGALIVLAGVLVEKLKI
jgi:drug/metabolite transporter (DMT)-like permease